MDEDEKLTACGKCVWHLNSFIASGCVHGHKVDIVFYPETGTWHRVARWLKPGMKPDIHGCASTGYNVDGHCRHFEDKDDGLPDPLQPFRWIPALEATPPNGVPVLTYSSVAPDSGGVHYNIMWQDDDGPQDPIGAHVTHWCPLPDPPQREPNN